MDESNETLNSPFRFSRYSAENDLQGRVSISCCAYPLPLLFVKPENLLVLDPPYLTTFNSYTGAWKEKDLDFTLRSVRGPTIFCETICQLPRVLSLGRRVVAETVPKKTSVNGKYPGTEKTEIICLIN